MQVELHELLFHIRRSIRYHNCRRRFFDNLNTTSQLISIIAGSATVFAVISNLGIAPYVAAVVTIFSAFNLVVSPTRKSILHADLAKRFIDLEESITGTEVVTEREIREFKRQRLRIERDEPVVLRCLDTLCHNEQLRADGYGEEHFLTLNRRQRWLAPLVDISPHLIKRAAQSEAPREMGE